MSLFDFPVTKIDKHALLYWTVTLLNTLTKMLDFFLDLAIGYSFRSGWSSERKEAESTGKTVQLVKIILRGAYGDTYTHTPDNFFYKHIRYVTPDYIIQKDKATLMGVTKTHFFFCVTLNPQINVVDTSISPFMFALQFYMSERLLIAKHSTIYELADQIGDPRAKLNFLDMTGRCGSTLVCTMMTRVPAVRVFSEPWVFLHAHNQYVNQHIHKEQYKRLLKTIVRILCRNETETEIQQIMIKLTIFLNSQIEVLQEVFPKAKYMFISRHYKPCVKSWIKLTNTLPTFFVAKRSLMANFFFDHFPYPYGDEKWEEVRKEWRDHRAQPDEYMKCFTMNFIGEMVSFRKFKERYDHIMLYEDLMANPDNETEKIFKVMNLDPKYIADAKQAFNFDSQRGKFGGRGTDHVAVPDKVWRDCRDLFQEYNLPPFLDMSLDEYRHLIYK